MTVAPKRQNLQNSVQMSVFQQTETSIFSEKHVRHIFPYLVSLPYLPVQVSLYLKRKNQISKLSS